MRFTSIVAPEPNAFDYGLLLWTPLDYFSPIPNREDAPNVSWFDLASVKQLVQFRLQMLHDGIGLGGSGDFADGAQSLGIFSCGLSLRSQENRLIERQTEFFAGEQVRPCRIRTRRRICRPRAPFAQGSAHRLLADARAYDGGTA